jgi:Flp pilus assembly pilin Flp
MPSFLLNQIHVFFSRLATLDEDGQGITEYALILGLIALATLAAVHFLTGKVTDVLSTVGNSL